jgi:hypothetical protein
MTVSIHFHVDEQLPPMSVRSLLLPRGHDVTRVRLGSDDPAILSRVEEEGGVILTADHWFYSQLRRQSGRDLRKYRRAGVVRVLGEWGPAERQWREWLPLIESAYEIVQLRDDKRLVVEFRSSAIYIDT